ncbi:MAG: hypothetical protein CME46_08300 [Halieaceae bacterium]|nr:hypothetical protein [Halieaceae bacterium]MDG1932844.1 surface lipoprotein assembly modifier [Luminiphilus sp.]MDG2037590.1 surface lipoprotein assembly modifier [Luminiphilus sp.]RZO79098.1 MAG: DUF560 domain-containing protein [Halieaceae bacterium]
MLNQLRQSVALTGGLLTILHALAGSSAELDLELAAGYAWDDNVGLDELERATGESDELTTLEAQGSALFTYQDRASLRLSAGLVDDSYQKFSQVDRRTESLGVNLEAQLGKATVGINWFDVSAELDDEQFLTYERLSPYVAGFVSKQWFLRGEYVYGEKEIARRPAREADSHSVSMDTYYFIQGLKRYAVMGYTFRVDNARANRYDYESHAIKFRYLHRETLGGFPLELELEGKYEDRQYKAPDPIIGTEREDIRWRFSAEARLSVTQYLSWALMIKNSDYDSNLPTASYSDLVVGSEIRLSF